MIDAGRRQGRGEEAPFSTPAKYSFGALLVIAVVFVWLAPRFWQEVEISHGDIVEAYENSELYHFVYPAFHHAFQRVRHGEIPLWNPRQLCGMPVHVDPRIGLFQPLHAPFILLPTERAMALHAFLCLSLMGTGFALFARSLNVRYTSCFVGAVVYAFSGASAAAMSRPWVADALAWSPLVFWSVREYLTRRRAANAVVAGLIGGFWLLSGSIAVVAAMFGALVPFAAVVARQDADGSAPSGRRRLPGIALAVGVALTVSAIQWLPSLIWILTLAHPADVVWNASIDAQAPLDLRDLGLQLILGRSGALPRMGYMGISTLLILPAALFDRPRRREVLCFVATSLGFVALYILVGQGLPLGFPRLALIFPVTLCVATLVSIGLDRIMAPVKNEPASPAWMPGLVVVAVSVGLFYAASGQIRGYVLAFACILAGIFLVRLRWFSGLCAVALGLFLFVDLAVANVNVYRHPFSDAPGCYHRYDEVLEVAQRRAAGGRGLVSARDLDVAMTENLGMLRDLDVIGGSLLPITEEQAAWWQALRRPVSSGAAEGARPGGSAATSADGVGGKVSPDAAEPRLLNLMAARVVLATPEGALYGGAWSRNGPRLHLTQTVGNVRLFINEDALPRAYWVPGFKEGYGAMAAADVLADPAFDHERECLVQEMPDDARALVSAPHAVSASERAQCSLLNSSAESVTIRVDAPRAGIAVLLDTWAPGWRATVDGRPAPVLRVNGLFRGVAIPAGPHEIVYTYRPTSLVVGAVASALGLALVALAIVGRALRGARAEVQPVRDPGLDRPPERC